MELLRGYSSAGVDLNLFYIYACHIYRFLPWMASVQMLAKHMRSVSTNKCIPSTRLVNRIRISGGSSLIESRIFLRDARVPT